MKEELLGAYKKIKQEEKRIAIGDMYESINEIFEAMPTHNKEIREKLRKILYALQEK